jgi:Fe-S cluster assembly iron-binding protein IscA
LGSLIITHAAKEAVERILGKNPGVGTVRLDLKAGACSWPSFGLTFHRKSDHDLVWSTGDIEWVIDRALFEKTGAITIDYVQGESGERFAIASDYRLAATCFGCSTCCKNNLTEEKTE